MSGPAAAEGGAPRRRTRPLMFVPFIAFIALAGLFLVRLGSGDPSRIPSALIDKPVPAFSLPALEAGAPDVSDADLASGVHLVNVWASWCGPCRLEHPILMGLSGDPRFELVGINYKDETENALRFIGTLGNPFDRIGADRSGAAGIDWGVYGVPETFVVADGVIRYKFIGPLDEERVAKDLMPAIERALGAAGS